MALLQIMFQDDPTECHSHPIQLITLSQSRPHEARMEGRLSPTRGSPFLGFWPCRQLSGLVSGHVFGSGPASFSVLVSRFFFPRVLHVSGQNKTFETESPSAHAVLGSARPASSLGWSPVRMQVLPEKKNIPCQILGWSPASSWVFWSPAISGDGRPPVLGMVARQFSGWSPASSRVGRPPVLGLVARHFAQIRQLLEDGRL